MPTLAIKIIKNRRNASGNINIYISLTFKREIRYIPTGFEIYDEAEFEDGKVCYRRDATVFLIDTNSHNSFLGRCFNLPPIPAN